MCDLRHISQIYMMYLGKLSKGKYSAGPESEEVRLFSESEIPWDDIAFRSGSFALKKYFEDRGENNGVHLYELRRTHIGNFSTKFLTAFSLNL